MTKKKKPAAKRPEGRPRTKLNLTKIRTLASEFCSFEEIAAAHNASQRTLIRANQENPEVREAIEVGKAQGRMHLRAMLWKLAKRGNVAAGIFLAKQPTILGYSDKAEMQHVGTGPGGAISHEIRFTLVEPPPRPGEPRPEPKLLEES